nr:early light-induced protein, chloroplastic-like [Ipomoea batatas]
MCIVLVIPISAKVAAKSSTDLCDALSFSSPGLERINSRLAIIGLAAAM